MSDDFVDYVMELLGPFGTVEGRRMFGGYGLFLDDLMFAIVSGDVLYLKSDAMNRLEFEQAGCEAFSYLRQGKSARLGFYRAPADAMESPELMLPWARSAYAAALRAHAHRRAAAAARAARAAKSPGAAAPQSKRSRPARAKKTSRRGKR